MVDKPTSFSYNGTQHSYVLARPHRLTVRTPGFHPGNPGSIPGEVTNIATLRYLAEARCFFICGIILRSIAGAKASKLHHCI